MCVHTHARFQNTFCIRLLSQHFFLNCVKWLLARIKITMTYYFDGKPPWKDSSNEQEVKWSTRPVLKIATPKLALIQYYQGPWFWWLSYGGGGISSLRLITSPQLFFFFFFLIIQLVISGLEWFLDFDGDNIEWGTDNRGWIVEDSF